MNAQETGLPVALTSAGSDSGGGAGIQADLKTFAALGVFGTSALTAITAQNPEGVTSIQAIDPPVVAAQIEAVCGYFPVRAGKTGMLFSTEIGEAVAEALDKRNAAHESGPLPLVVDPVMVATSGAKLLNDDAIGALCRDILPRAAVLTPNMDEAALLAERPVAARGGTRLATRWADTNACGPAATRRMRRRASISPWRSPSRPRPVLAAAASAWSRAARLNVRFGS